MGKLQVGPANARIPPVATLSAAPGRGAFLGNFPAALSREPSHVHTAFACPTPSPSPHRAPAWVYVLTLRLPLWKEAGPWEGAFPSPSAPHRPGLGGDSGLQEDPESTSWFHHLCHSINSQESSVGISPLT